MLEIYYFVWYIKYMENLNQIVANNLVYYRKKEKLTQAELAEKISYSDKAVSKWERGESLPDLVVLTTLAEMYGITVNDFLVAEHHEKVSKVSSLKSALKNKKLLISLLSVCLVWIIATISFVVCQLIQFYTEFAWKFFVYAIPVSAIVAFIFSCIWGRLITRAIVLSAVLWGTFVAIYFAFAVQNMWLIFMIAIPVQGAIVIWYFLIRQINKIEKHKKNIKENSINQEQ